MARIRIFDGTRNQKYGQALEAALNELSKLIPVKTKPRPGSIDMPGYELVKYLEQKSFNPDRGQVSRDRLLTLADKIPEIGGDRSTQKIILVENDLYTPSVNWCFGGFTHFNGNDYIVISTARIKNLLHFADINIHELGHMSGAPRPGRSNTIEHLGTHCINDLCVMQQKDTVEASVAYSRQRHQLKADSYCSQCKQDIIRYARHLPK
ncbi:hypothetical protein KY348_04825 [Candidatus Woesearchaeota archaeon]|nr:hypothetical protein [Candidatus Woesearchaeota archaeon]